MFISEPGPLSVNAIVMSRVDPLSFGTLVAGMRENKIAGAPCCIVWLVNGDGAWASS